MIFFENGTKEVFFTTQWYETETVESIEEANKTSFNKYGHIKIFNTPVFFAGAGFSVFNNYNIGNPDDFWKFLTSDNSAFLKTKPFFYYLNIGTKGAIDSLNKNHIGTEIQFSKTSKKAIYGSNASNTGRSEVIFNACFFNMTINYYRRLDRKNKLFLIINPAINIGFMGGTIYRTGTSYSEANTYEMGWQVSTGIDYFLEKKYGINFRFGYRQLEINEIHADPQSPIGSSAFLTNNTDGNRVNVDWSGLYSTIGISVLLNSKKTRK
ncbi:MAG: hypothetical protein PHD97_07640 [Bacteroidales bacterium]|nr:hypothetical protein [Bacteroidales bacterium]